MDQTYLFLILSIFLVITTGGAFYLLYHSMNIFTQAVDKISKPIVIKNEEKQQEFPDKITPIDGDNTVSLEDFTPDPKRPLKIKTRVEDGNTIVEEVEDGN